MITKYTNSPTHKWINILSILLLLIIGFRQALQVILVWYMYKILLLARKSVQAVFGYSMPCVLLVRLPVYHFMV